MGEEHGRRALVPSCHSSGKMRVRWGSSQKKLWRAGSNGAESDTRSAGGIRATANEERTRLVGQMVGE